MPITDTGLKLFRKAQIWYAINGATLMSPKDSRSQDFFGKEKLDGALAVDCSEMQDLAPNIFPLLAAIQSGFDVPFLAQVIEHHGISKEQLERFGYDRHKDTYVFMNHVGVKMHLTGIYIPIMKACEFLGRPLIPDFTNPYALVAGMHTGVEESWPVSIVEKMAKLKKNRENAGYTRFGDFFRERKISSASLLPNSSPEDFLHRSGMLSKVTYRKEIKVHCLWEELILKVAKGDSVATLVLDFCKNASESDKVIIRNALTCMHPAGLVSSSKSEELSIWHTLRNALKGSDLADVTDSIILMLNFSATGRDVFPENISPDTLLARICKEILERDFDQVGFAHLKVFTTFKNMSASPQITDGVVPEQLILKLDKAIDDMLGLRDERNQQIDEMLEGFQAAFTLLSPNHKWDMALLNGCTSLGQMLLVQAGANIRDFKGLSRVHRGQILEAGLGL